MTYKRRLKAPLKGDFKQGIKGDYKDNNINMNNINKNNSQRTERKKMSQLDLKKVRLS